MQLHGHIFQRISTKFSMWHPYTLRMVPGGKYVLVTGCIGSDAPQHGLIWVSPTNALQHGTNMGGLSRRTTTQH